MLSAIGQAGKRSSGHQTSTVPLAISSQLLLDSIAGRSHTTLQSVALEATAGSSWEKSESAEGIKTETVRLRN